ncbi:UNVERIFIED_CONTAM: Ceramide synthase 6 [Gekko kuhli]
MAGILAWFWNERFWLPHNVTWADLKNTEEATLPQAEDLYLAFPLAFCIFMIRMVFERSTRVTKPCAAAVRLMMKYYCATQHMCSCRRKSGYLEQQYQKKLVEGCSERLLPG